VRKVVETLLPTTMVGSYPRPKWFTYQLAGRDVQVAFKAVDHAEAFSDATRVSIQDQEEAGLDIVTDGQMVFDDYVGVIGSFCWYWYERLDGFTKAKLPHPLAAAIEASEDAWGGGSTLKLTYSSTERGIAVEVHALGPRSPQALPLARTRPREHEELQRLTQEVIRCFVDEFRPQVDAGSGQVRYRMVKYLLS